MVCYNVRIRLWKRYFWTFSNIQNVLYVIVKETLHSGNDISECCLKQVTFNVSENSSMFGNTLFDSVLIMLAYMYLQ